MDHEILNEDIVLGSSQCWNYQKQE